LPGEFTERALLNGKLDLVGAEGIAAIIDARTHAAHRGARAAISGELTARYARLREQAIGLEAMLAYDIDFPEEDSGPLRHDAILREARALEAGLTDLQAAGPAGRIARDGAMVVLAGPPNAGKSSLFNALLGEERAIVSDEPGTTRDAIEVLVDSRPWPMRLVDTAGVREDAGRVEQLGIEVSHRYLGSALVVLACAEYPDALAALTEWIRGKTDATVIAVHTKGDRANTTPAGAVRVSATTGDGLQELKRHMREAIAARAGSDVPDARAGVTVRQRAAVQRALAEIREFATAWTGDLLPPPVAATHVRAATSALDEIIGSVDVDDVLARVFSTFCVGK
jgi:tRNA modification GTPase